jgi:hypothetical protein
MFVAVMIGKSILSHRSDLMLMLLSLRTMSHSDHNFSAEGSDMNMSQQRFFLLMQKLEGIDAALAAVRKDVSETAEIVVAVDEFMQVLNYRLIFAGQALLLQTPQGFNEMAQKKYNRGLGIKEAELAESADPSIGRRHTEVPEKNRPQQTHRE